MPKPPAFMFYVKDWLTDEAVARLDVATRGFWIDCLCWMWLSQERGVLRDVSMPELSTFCRCDETQAAFHVTELKRCKVADVTECNGHVTLVNRRMVRDATSSASSTSRVRAFRKRKNETVMKRDGNENETPPLAYAYACADACNTPLPPAGGVGEEPVRPHESEPVDQQVAHWAGVLHRRVVEVCQFSADGNGKGPRLEQLTGMLREQVGQGYTLAEVERCCRRGGVNANECVQWNRAGPAIAEWFRVKCQKIVMPKRILP